MRSGLFLSDAFFPPNLKPLRLWHNRLSVAIPSPLSQISVHYSSRIQRGKTEWMPLRSIIQVGLKELSELAVADAKSKGTSVCKDSAAGGHSTLVYRCNE